MTSGKISSQDKELLAVDLGRSKSNCKGVIQEKKPRSAQWQCLKCKTDVDRPSSEETKLQIIMCGNFNA